MHKAKAVTPITDLAVLQQQLAAIQASSSWRITSPLRFLARAAKRLLGKSAASSSPPALVLNDYSEWIRQFDSLSNEVSANFLAQIDTFSHLPLFSILLPIQNAALQLMALDATAIQAGALAATPGATLTVLGGDGVSRGLWWRSRPNRGRRDLAVHVSGCALLRRGRGQHDRHPT